MRYYANEVMGNGHEKTQQAGIARRDRWKSHRDPFNNRGDGELQMTCPATAQGL